MALLCANALPVASDWDSRALLLWQSGAVKLDVFVNGADVIAQVSDDPSGAFIADGTQEMLLRVGFNSRPFTTRITAVRFKVWAFTLLPAAGATVDVTLYA